MWYYPSIKSEGSSSYVPPSWSEGTDAEIVEALEKHYAGDIDITKYWSIGDERTVHLSAMSDGYITVGQYQYYIPDSHVEQDVTFVLTEVGGKILSDGVTECAFQVDQKDCLLEGGAMVYNTGSCMGWDSSVNPSYANTRRIWCNNVYKDAIPVTLRPIFKEYVNSSYIYNSGVLTTNDYFALRSQTELMGYSANGNEEGTYITYYKTGANVRKNIVNPVGLGEYWTRSLQTQYNQNYVTVHSNSYYYDTKYEAYNGAYYLAPFGVI